MMSSSPLLLCTCTILCLLLALNSEAKPPPIPTAPDHSLLVYTWPIGYCSKPGITKRCQLAPLPKKLVLHGLWPVDSNGQSIVDCQAEEAKWGQYVNDVLLKNAAHYNSMKEHWPSLVAPAKPIDQPISFWRHEYFKHGSCFPAETPKIYFPRVINLKMKLSLYEALLAAKITPGNAYPRTAFEDVVREKLGSSDMVMIKCYKSNGQIILEEIIICIDGKGVAPVPCLPIEKKSMTSCGTGTTRIRLLDR